MLWPTDFLWGTGASSTQCEGAAPASDWKAWEAAGRAPASGEGSGFATRYGEDFALYRQLGLRQHRLSIEWARIEPQPGRVDDAAVAHYRDILAAAREAGIAVWVCLHHFTLPAWFAAAGGFLDPGLRSGAWLRHVERIAELFGDRVAGWKPVNEPHAYALLGWMGMGFPPGASDRDGYLAALEAIQLATAEAGMRLRQSGRPVATVHNLAPIVALDEASAAVADFIDAGMWRSWIGLQRDGVLAVPGRAPVARPDLAGWADLIGFSYYFTLGLQHGGVVPYPAGAPLSPLGYAIGAGGLRLVLERLARELPAVPLLISEYGIGTHDDAQRAAYLRDGLAIAHEAIAVGVPLRGFFHWTGVDNYEWIHGYDVPFGVIDRDRRVRASADVLAAEALPSSRSA
jgi:beta-glucosidase